MQSLLLLAENVGTLLRAHPWEPAPADAHPLVACANSGCTMTLRGWWEKAHFHMYPHESSHIKIGLDTASAV